MKLHYKIITAIALQSLTVCGFADGDVVNSNSRFNVFIPNLKSGLEFSASALVLQPEVANLGWAVVTTVLPIPTPQWRVQSFNPGYKTGFNAGVRYVFENSGSDIQLNWSYLHANYDNAVSVDPASQWVSPFSQTGTPPTGGEITGVASLKRATAKLNFDYNSVNLDIGKFVNFGSDLQTRFFAGLESTWIKEKLISNFYGQPKILFSLNNTSSYSGVGPRLGLHNSYDVSHGLNLIGQFAGAIMMGRMQPAQYEFAGASSDLALVGIGLNREKVASSRVNQIVPAVDAKLGLSYNYILQQNSELNFELGYMGAVYVNALSAYETNTNVIALDSGSLSTSSVRYIQSNFLVAGPYATIRLHC